MNLKRIFAGAVSVVMALSAFNFSYAEPTGEFVDIGGTFAENKAGFGQIDMGTVSFSANKSHTEDGTGSLKFEGVTYQGTSGDRVAVGRSLNKAGLEIGETYLLKAYVYGERIKDGDYARIDILSGYNSNENKYTKFVSGNTALKSGEWTEVSQYFIATDKIDTFKFVFPSITTSTGYDANAETYGIVYIDDVTIEKQTDADDYFNSLTDGPKVKYANTTTIRKAFAGLDITKTKNVLVENETVELKAFLQDCAAGKTAADLVRTAADTEYITVTSSNNAVASYENGKITGHVCGNALITATYNDGTKTAASKMLVTVHPNNEDSFILGRGNANYAVVTDPIDSNDTARIILTNTNLSSDVSASKPAVVSFKIYNPSGPKANGETNRFVNIKANIGTDWFNLREDKWVEHTLSVNGAESYIDSYSVAGWESVDMVISYPVNNSYSDGYRLIDYYLNGNKVYSAEKQLKSLDGRISISAGDNTTVMLRDLAIVSMDAPFAVQYTNPSDGEKLSTLDDIDVVFNENAVIEDVDNCAALYKGEEKVETVNVLASDSKKLSVIPQGGLDMNTQYTLKLDAESIKNTSGGTLTGTAEFTFTTTNDKVSDVIGSGYKLLNSQVDIIKNGSFKMSSTKNGQTSTTDADKSDSETLHLPSGTDTDRNISIPFDDSFKTSKISPDRVIVEFDTKVDSVLNTDKKDKDLQQEGWNISGMDADGHTGTLTKLGYSRTYNNLFYIWKGNFALDENGNRQNGTTTGTYKVEGYGDNPIDVKNGIIDNIGYIHVKVVYDLKQTDPSGDVKQTVYITGGGLNFTKEFYSAMFTGYPNTSTLSEFSLFARNLTGAYENIYKSKDTYLKNLNVYALQSAPELIPDAEISVTSIIDDDFVNVENAADLNGKTIIVTSVLKNNKLGETPYVLVAAAYDKATNKLIDTAVSEPGTISNGAESEEFEAELDLTGFTEGTAEIRIFAWNSMEGAKPLAEVYKPF